MRRATPTPRDTDVRAPILTAWHVAGRSPTAPARIPWPHRGAVRRRLLPSAMRAARSRPGHLALCRFLPGIGLHATLVRTRRASTDCAGAAAGASGISSARPIAVPRAGAPRRPVSRPARPSRSTTSARGRRRARRHVPPDYPPLVWVAASAIVAATRPSPPTARTLSADGAPTPLRRSPRSR